MSFQQMQFVERAIARMLVDALIIHGPVRVYDTENWVTDWTSDKWSIINALGACDEEYLYIRRMGFENPSWVRLIWGNGEDLICDYTTDLEVVMAPINQEIHGS